MPPLTLAGSRIGAEIRHACETAGFFYVTGHGLPAGALDRAFAAARSFFERTQRAKDASTAGMPLFRGYNSLEHGSHSCTPEDTTTTTTTTTPKKKVKPDAKESYTLGACGEHSPMHGDNVWPQRHADDIEAEAGNTGSGGAGASASDGTGSGSALASAAASTSSSSSSSSPSLSSPSFDPSAFRAILDAHFADMLAVSKRVAQGLALSLGLGIDAAAEGGGEAGDADDEMDFFKRNMGEAVAQMVLLRYPPVLLSEADEVKGCGAHTDCGFLTILAQETDGVPGLEVQRRQEGGGDGDGKGCGGKGCDGNGGDNSGLALGGTHWVARPPGDDEEGCYSLAEYWFEHDGSCRWRLEDEDESECKGDGTWRMKEEGTESVIVVDLTSVVERDGGDGEWRPAADGPHTREVPIAIFHTLYVIRPQKEKEKDETPGGDGSVGGGEEAAGEGGGGKVAGDAGGEAEGEWEAAPSIPGTLLVNLGDMTHRWTNGRYKSTWHRVKANSRNGARSRYSMPFFCNLVRRQMTCGTVRLGTWYLHMVCAVVRPVCSVQGS